MNSFHDLVINRRSIRKYTGEPLDPEHVKLILEAALMSPAGKRRNPWHFVVVEDKEVLKALSQVKDNGALPLAGASIAIAVVANPEDSDTWVEDLSIACYQMQLQCTDLGLGSVWIHIRNRFDTDGNTATYNTCQILEIPAPYEVLAIISIGHPDEIRKPYDTSKLQWEKVHIGKF